MGRDTARLGRIGEQVAARHLESLGYEIVDRNWRCARGEVRGELDLIAHDGGVLVVCEVKARRRADVGVPVEAVDPRKLARLRRLAAAWLAEHGWAGDVRFDVVAVSWPPAGGGAEVVHLRGVG